MLTDIACKRFGMTIKKKIDVLAKSGMPVTFAMHLFDASICILTAPIAPAQVDLLHWSNQEFTIAELTLSQLGTPQYWATLSASINQY